jgi:AraC-like DNA-binding protein
VPEILREFGCEPGPVLEDAGFKLEQFEDPDTEISFVAGSQLLARCVRVTGCQHFGFLLGVNANSSSLGIAGFMLRFAPNVATALHALIRHLELHDQGGVPLLTSRGDLTSLGYAVIQSGAEAIDQIHDLSAAVACNIMRDLCGSDWNPDQVLMPRRQPPELTPYQRFFRAPLRFDTEQNAVVFPTRWLDHQISNADPLLYRHLEKEANERHDYRTTATTGKVRRLIRKSLASGDFTVGEVARHLRMHQRTLHRRLREEDTSFRRELDDVRYEVARQLLTESAASLANIAKALGYADTSAFVRSFKRWSGTTPGQWRSRHGRP